MQYACTHTTGCLHWCLRLICSVLPAVPWPWPSWWGCGIEWHASGDSPPPLSGPLLAQPDTAGPSTAQSTGMSAVCPKAASPATEPHTYACMYIHACLTPCPCYSQIAGVSSIFTVCTDTQVHMYVRML